MKLLSNNIITLGLFRSIYNNVGEEIFPPHIILLPKSTPILITKVSDDVFSINTPSSFNDLMLGENIKLERVDFDIDLTIIEKGHNLFRVKNRFKDKTYDYDEEPEIFIPDGATTIRRNEDVLMPIDLEFGEYYSDLGEVLLVGNGFNHLKSLSADDIYTLKPELKGKGIEAYELEKMLRLATDFVFEDLSGIEIEENERFRYLNIDGLKKLILFRTISIYESSFPNESGEYSYIYGRKYKSKLNGFLPYKKINSNGNIEDARKRGIRY